MRLGVLIRGAQASAGIGRARQRAVEERTAPYPRVVDFVDALPKTVNGKIRRAAIRDNDAGNREE